MENNIINQPTPVAVPEQTTPTTNTQSVVSNEQTQPINNNQTIAQNVIEPKQLDVAQHKTATDWLKFIVFIFGTLVTIFAFLWLILAFSSYALWKQDSTTLSDKLWTASRYFALIASSCSIPTFGVLVSYLGLQFKKVNKTNMKSSLATYIFLLMVAIVLFSLGIVVLLNTVKSSKYDDNILKFVQHIGAFTCFGAITSAFGAFDNTKEANNKNSLKWLSISMLFNMIVVVFTTIFVLIGGLKNYEQLKQVINRDVQFWMCSYLLGRYLSALLLTAACLSVTNAVFYGLTFNNSKAWIVRVVLWSVFTILILVFASLSINTFKTDKYSESQINWNWFENTKKCTWTVTIAAIIYVVLAISSLITNKKEKNLEVKSI